MHLLYKSKEQYQQLLAELRYRPEFGRGAVHRLASPQEKDADGRTKPRGAPEPVLFGEPVTFSDLSGALGRGGEIRATAISDELTWEQFLELHPDAIPLFAVDDRERLQFFQVGVKLAPKKDWQVYALHPLADGDAKPA